MHNYSPEELLLYLYKELPSNTTIALEEALQNDWTLREKLAVMKTSMQRLDSIISAPRTEIVLNVLKYADKEKKLTSFKN